MMDLPIRISTVERLLLAAYEDRTMTARFSGSVFWASYGAYLERHIAMLERIYDRYVSEMI